MEHFHGRLTVLVKNEGCQLGPIWAKWHAAEVHDAGFTAFPTQKYRYMPSSSPLAWMLDLCNHAQVTRILQVPEQRAGRITRVKCGVALLHPSVS